MSVLILGVRHGRTTDNKKGVLRAWADAHLDANGKLDAQLAARKLTIYNPKMVYHSDLTRDTQTGAIIAEHFNIPNEPDFGLRTADMGEWTEQPEDEVRDGVRSWYQNPWLPSPSGESYDQFMRRFLPAFDKKLAQAEMDPYRPTVAVMHGRNFAALDSLYNGIEPWRATMPVPGGIAVIRSNGSDFPPYTIEYIGQTEQILDDR